jgi:Ca-activated chloride channel family protein
MIKGGITYQFKRLASLVIVWEIIFWVLFFLLIRSGRLLNSDKSDFFVFEESQKLQWLWLIIFVAGLFLYNIYRNEKIYLNVGEKIRSTVFKPVSTRKSFISYFLFRNAIVFLIIAMAQPAFGIKKVSGTIQSMELVICLDVSNSMNTRDIDPKISRLGIAKRAINELINKLGGEKIGISIFANNAYTQLPLTLDYYAAKMYVNDIETNMISAQGTNIKNALENAYSMFSENKKMSKAVILVTDGENHDEDPSSILKKYKEEEIQLAVLGVGTKKGGLIPEYPEEPERGYKRSATGMTVHSKLNPEFLNRIAKDGGGIAIVSENAFPDLRSLLKQITHMKRVKTDGMDFEVKEQRYQIPLAISLSCFVLYLVWSGSYIKRFRFGK